MTPKELRSITGLNATKFAEKYGIPPSTYNKWELPDDAPNHRDCPDYTLALLERVVRYDFDSTNDNRALILENQALWEVIEKNKLSREAYLAIRDLNLFSGPKKKR